MYYRIWVDCILKAKSIPRNRNNWKVITIIFMSMTMTLNLMFLMAILQRYIVSVDFYGINLDIFPGSILNSAADFFILFLLPILLLNYILIFHNRRYKQLIKKHEYRNGNLFITFFLCSLFLPLLVLYFGMIISRM